jgi:hypothetical protein
MDDGRRSNRADCVEQFLRLADVALEGNGRLAELGGQVTPDEAVGPGDQNGAYRGSTPSPSRPTLLSSKAMR